MLRVSRAVLVLVCFLAPCGVSRAGVYFTSPRDPFPMPTSQETVKSLIADLTMLVDVIAKQVNKTTPLRQKLLERVEKELEPKLNNGELSLTDRINLAAGYIRLGRYAKAIPILNAALLDGPQQVKDDAPERFLLLANLAVAFHGINDLRGAIRTQKEVIAVAAGATNPPVSAWSAEQWKHYRMVESYYLRLLELRKEETERGPAAQQMTTDDLFPMVRFVSSSGKYEAGKLAPESLQLPRDTLPIVVQLLIWMPTDGRLMWLYGELLNAEGRINEAYWTLRDLVFSGAVSGPEIIKHRKILQGALVPEKPFIPEEKLSIVEPQKIDDKPAKLGTDWRALGTGFLAGFLVAAFGGVQIYLWLRRRRTPTPPVELDRTSAPSASAG